MMKKVRIVSDGIPHNTIVYDAETGQMIHGITKVDVHIDATGEYVAEITRLVIVDSMEIPVEITEEVVGRD